MLTYKEIKIIDEKLDQTLRQVLSMNDSNIYFSGYTSSVLAPGLEYFQWNIQ